MALDDVNKAFARPVYAFLFESVGVFQCVFESFHESNINQIRLEHKQRLAIIAWQEVLYLQFWLMQVIPKPRQIRAISSSALVAWGWASAALACGIGLACSHLRLAGPASRGRRLSG